MSRAITWISKFDLSVHAAVAQTPEDRGLIELLVSDMLAELKRGTPPDKLIHDLLEVNPENEVEDGRHRLLAALRIDKLVELPCQVVEGSNPEALVCKKLLQRRHYTKSARAYALRHQAAKAAQAGKEARAAANLVHKVAGGGYRKPTESAFDRETTLESLAAASLLSVDLLQQAVKLEGVFVEKSDAKLTLWLENNPDHNESWLAFRDANVALEMPWSLWRAQALLELGHKDDPASHNIIPKNWREIEEDKIFNGLIDPNGEDDDRKSYSLGAALKAMGSYHATAAKPRADLDPDEPDMPTVLANKLKSFSKTMWQQWNDLPMEGRITVLERFTSEMKAWPPDVLTALRAHLNKKEAAS